MAQKARRHMARMLQDCGTFWCPLLRPVAQVNRPLPPSGLSPKAPLSSLTSRSGKVRVSAGLPKISSALGFKLEFSGTKGLPCSNKRQGVRAGQGNQETGLRHTP